MRDPRLARVEYLIREQDEKHEKKVARLGTEAAALKADTAENAPELTDVDRHRLKLLDWLNERCPNNVVSEHGVAWEEVGGREALVLREGLFSEGEVAYVTIAGDYLYVIGPMGGGVDGVIAVHPDGKKELIAAWQVTDD